MNNRPKMFLAVLLVLPLLLSATLRGDDWPQWRGPLGTGAAPNADPPVMQTKHGHGESASPVLYGDLLFVNWDHDGPCFVAAFDKRTGQQRWKVDSAASSR